MFCVIDSSNRAAYADALQQIARLRSPGTLGGFCRGINNKVSPSEFEDRSATDAVHLIAFEGDCVTGGITLMNSARGMIVGSAFPELYASGGPVQDDKVQEFSRFFLAEDKSHRPYVERFGEIFAAACNCALERGASHVSLICDMDILALLLSLGLAVVPLGVPAEYDKVLCVAVLIEISQDAVTTVRERAADLGRLAKRTFH